MTIVMKIVALRACIGVVIFNPGQMNSLALVLLSCPTMLQLNEDILIGTVGLRPTSTRTLDWNKSPDRIRSTFKKPQIQFKFKNRAVRRGCDDER
jgi:hypothetical protein